MRKNAPFWPIIWPLWPWPWSHDLQLCARTLRYSIPIYPASFAKIGWWERGEKGVTDGRLDMIWLLHKVLTWFQAWKSHVAGWLLQRRLYPLFQCCGVDLLDIHLHTARARVTIIKFLIPLVFPIQFQPLPDEETVDRSHYIIIL